MGITGGRTMMLAVAGTATMALAAGPVASGASGQAPVRVKGPNYGKTFKLVSCKNAGETDIALSGKARGLTLRVVGRNKTGKLTIRGVADLDGKLTSIVVGDAGNYKVKGRFTTGGVTGTFTVTGSCA